MSRREGFTNGGAGRLVVRSGERPGVEIWRVQRDGRF